MRIMYVFFIQNQFIHGVQLFFRFKLQSYTFSELAINDGKTICLLDSIPISILSIIYEHRNELINNIVRVNVGIAFILFPGQ